MAFKLDQSPSYRWPVPHMQVSEDGTCEEVLFHVRYKRMLQPEIEKVIEEFQAEPPSVKLNDRAFCERYVVGFDEVESEDGTPLLFSETGLSTLLDRARVATSITLAWFESIKIGQEKNSVKLPEPGPPPPAVQH